MSDTTVVVDTNANPGNAPDVVLPRGGESPDTTQASADTAVPGENAEGQPQAEPKRDRKVEKRISRLTQQREAAIREAGYWRGIAEANATRGNGQEPTGEEPQRQERSPQRTAADDAGDDLSRKAMARIEQGGEGIEDFDEVVETLRLHPRDGGPPISPVMRDYFTEAEHPAELAKWLVENREEALRISRLSDAMAVRALERADAKLSKAKPAPRTTQAPAPLSTVGGSSKASVDPQTGPRNGSMDDYATWRRSA